MKTDITYSLSIEEVEQIISDFAMQKFSQMIPSGTEVPDPFEPEITFYSMYRHSETENKGVQVKISYEDK